MLTLVIVYDAWTKVGLWLEVTGLSCLSCDAKCVAWDLQLSGRQHGYSMRNFLPIPENGEYFNEKFSSPQITSAESERTRCVSYETTV
jgi:hypothetical protein